METVLLRQQARPSPLWRKQNGGRAFLLDCDQAAMSAAMGRQSPVEKLSADRYGLRAWRAGMGEISKNNNFDLLRLFAALEVVYMHSIYHLDLWSGPAAFFHLFQSLSGVPIFFVISGFLVTDSYLRSSSARGFAVKRALRIYPGLIANIAILEILVAMTGGFSPTLVAVNYLGFFAVYVITAAAPWAGHFFDSPYISYGFFAEYPSGVLWTLTVELTFYMILPLALEAGRRSRAIGVFYLAAGTGASMLVAMHFNVSDKMDTFVSVSIAPYFWIFALGVGARLYWSTLRILFERRAAWWFAAHVSATIFSLETGGSGAIYFGSPDTLIVGRTVILAGLTLSVAYTVPRPALLRQYDISYGVYLYHMLVLQTMISMGYTHRFRYWIVAFGASIALGALSFILIERPAMNFRRRVQKREAPAISTA